MKAFKTLFCVSVASAMLTGCSEPPTADEIEAKLIEMTVKVTGASPTEAPKVSGQRTVGSRWVWTATVSGKTFDCDSDTFFELPACEPVVQSGA
jgi:hypothetical protein